MKKYIIGSIGVLAILVGMVSIERIPAGYVGVVYSPTNGVEKDVLTQGWHMVNPFKSVNEYSVAIEQVYMSADSREGSIGDESIGVSTSEGEVVNVSIEYSYRFNTDDVSTLFTRFRGKTGDEISDVYMRGKIRTFISEITTKYSVLDLYGSKRAEINTEILKYVKDQFAKDSIVIESAKIIEVIPDKQTKKAIQSRINTSQEKERQSIEAEKAIIEAQKNKNVAEGVAVVNKIKTDNEAYMIKTKADAEAYALQKQREQITQTMIDYEKAKRTQGFDGVTNLTIMDSTNTMKVIK